MTNRTTSDDFLVDIDALDDVDFLDAKPAPKNVDLSGLGSVPRVFVERCGKCNGTGQYGQFGRCFQCGGRGQKTFKNSFADRAKARDKAADRRSAAAQATYAAWAQANPARAAWLERTAPRFPFAASLLSGARRFGSLTEAQAASVDRLIARDAERSAARSELLQSAAVVDVSPLVSAMATASRSGLGPVKLRLVGFTISRAPETGKNPGALYVKRGSDYLGKFHDGKFVRSSACTQDDEAALLAAAADPKAAAVAYGRQTGSCACCGRLLTNAESISLGIGPICASKYGW